MNNQHPSFGSGPQQMPGNQPSRQPSSFQRRIAGNGGSNVGWWLGSGLMAVLLIVGIVILISMFTGGSSENRDSKSEAQDQLAAGEEEDGDSNIPPGNSGNEETGNSNEISSGLNIESPNGNTHQSSFGYELPLLPIPQADYVFLNASRTLPSEEEPGSRYEGCFYIGYDIAFKGEWEDQVLDDIFDQNRLFKEIETAAAEIYPAEIPKYYFIILNVYQYSGSEELSDYLEQTPESSSKFYSRNDCNY